MRTNQPSETVIKALADEITAALRELIDLPSISKIVENFVRKRYMTSIDRMELEYDMNFQANPDTIKFMREGVFSNVHGLVEEVQARVQREIAMGLAQNETHKQIKKRIANIFKGDNPTRFSFEERIDMIERTETIRAENYAAVDAARQLPFAVKKRVSVLLDSRTSEICREMHRLYGEDHQAIPLDKPFKANVKLQRKTMRAKNIIVTEMAPPFHPNCRSSVQLVRQEEEEE